MRKFILLLIGFSFSQRIQVCFPYYNLGNHTFEEFVESRKKYGKCWEFKMFGKALVWLPCHFECDQNKTKCRKQLSYTGKKLQSADIEILSMAIGEYKCESKNNISKEESKMLIDEYAWTLFAPPEAIRESKLYKATYDKMERDKKNPFNSLGKKGSKNPFEKVK